MGPLETQDAPYRSEPMAEGIRFVLPRRPGGKGGICAILFGLLFSGFAVFWMLAASGLLDTVVDSVFGSAHESPHPQLPADSPEALDPEGPEGPETPETPAMPLPPPVQPQPKPTSGGFDIGRIFFALFGIPFFLVGLVPIGAGILALVGHSEIEVTPMTIVYIDCAGPFRRRQTRVSENLIKIEIGRSAEQRAKELEQSAQGKPVSGQGFNAIHAEFRDAAPLVIAKGYPLTTLRPLGKDLAQEHQRLTANKRVPIEEPVNAEIQAADAQPYIREESVPQPLSSNVEVERVASGITLRVPPTGFVKAAMFPLIFGVVWCGFISIFTFAMIATNVPWPFYLFISVFWLIGIFMIFLGIDSIRKRAVIDVVHGTLLVTVQGLRGSRQHEWRADELLDIRVDDSGTSINDRAIQNLQFVPREGRTLGLFTGRDEEELRWMATELRIAMQLRKRA